MNNEFEPKPLSTRQNVILTLKVMAGAAALVGLLWLASLKA
jgi:hypothetical protein